MSAQSDTEAVQRNVSDIFLRKEAAIYGISLYYATEALNLFRANQTKTTLTDEKYWNNQTFQARDRVFSNAFKTGRYTVGWRISHGVEYGVYLELANNRKHESLRPIVEKFKTPYLWACGEMYKDRPEVPK